MEKRYRKILKKAIKSGVYRDDRTKVGSYSLFNQSLSWNLSKGFPIITGRKIYENIFNTEFDWFINGETNIDRFKKNNVKIWDKFADKNGDLGLVYGHQLINFNSQGFNQLQSVIDSVKNNPDGRRHIISLWNPAQTEQMALPPCYLYFQFFVDDENLNLFIVQRSGDLFLGIPYDVALFSKLLLYVAEKANLKAKKVDLQIVDAHVYKNQLSAIKEYLKTERYDLPKFTYKNEKLEIINYQYDKKITCEVAI